MKDCEKFVGNAIRSITEQDFPHDLMEVIFVDDGSKDNTLSIVNNWIPKTDIRMKVFSYDWRGIAKSRNTVLDNAEGIFIMWVDSDEILSKSYVRNQVEFMENNPHVGIATGTLGILPTYSFVLRHETLVDIVNEKKIEESKELVGKTKTPIPGTGGAIFRTDALKYVNGFDDKLSGVGEDIDVGTRIVRAGWQVAWTSTIYYETHGGLSTMTQLWKKYFWRGYYHRILYMKDKSYFSLVGMSPLGSLIAGVIFAIKAYKYTFMKQSFLIPLTFTFRQFAWFLGFVKNQINTF